ncbi:zinc ABC transporter substrate-binding protein [Xylanimonas oleitrophica]|uniref:Zinc ABC transporter substrate-binding protein n=1 Tax=Xylanimonas oleitrophica TaxID=2607479 RepID=A0A2W5WZD3_9MICO|nr:ABC transporter substrate-binding protein [Xylanimonas oleitrophica]PZR53746.1 zinc ABC transporter substrate-binding protein [Xylanimonas oleitrophica]
MNTTLLRRTAPAALALGALAALTACGSAVTAAGAGGGTAAADGYPVTVENCGRTLTVDSAPERIVGLSPAQTELLVRLGLADRLAGQAQTDMHELPNDVAPQVTDVPVLSTSTPPARETLLEVHPDAVVAPTEYEFTAEQGFATIDQLAQAGAVTYVAAGGCSERRATGEVTDLFTDIDALGRIFGVTGAAEDLAAEARADLQAVDEAVADRPRPSVAQLYVEGKTLAAIGAGVEYDMIARAGGDNVFNPEEKLFEQFFSAIISPEEVAARNPDAIVFAVRDQAEEARVREYLRQTFPDVTAVKEDRLVALRTPDTFPGTLGNVTAVRTIAEALHPDAF